MRAAIILAAAMTLAGCASYTPDASQLFVPEIYDATRYQADVDACTKDVKGMKNPDALNDYADAGASGLAQNAGSAPVTWLIPVAGAAGKIGYVALRQLGIVTPRQAGGFRRCLDRKTEWDRSALYAEPED